MGGSNRPSGPMVMPAYPQPGLSGGYPPGMTPYFGDWRPGMPGGPGGSPDMGFGGGSFDPNQQFNFDSDMWEGPYGAPLTTLQLDSMGAMQRMLQADPLAQTQDIQQAIQQALGGGEANFGPADLGQFQDMFQGVFGGAQPQLGPGSNMGAFEQQFGDIMGQLQGQGMPDFGRLFGAADAARSPMQGTDIASLLSQAQGLYGGIPQAGAEGADLIRNATGLSAGSQAIFDQTIPAFGELLAGPSFDTTEMFAAGNEAFQGDLDRAMAQAREEFSSLGLDPGSTDRAEGLARTGATESARFRAGQQAQAMQAFENAQQRRLGAAGLAPSLSAAFENPMDRMLQAGGMLSQMGLQGAGMQGDLLSQITNMSQIPFEQQLAQRGIDVATLPAELQAAMGAGQQGLQAAGMQANMLPSLLQALQIPFGEEVTRAGMGLQGSSLQAQMLPQLLQAAGLGFDQNMGMAQLGLQGQQVGASMIPNLMQAFNNPAMMAQAGFDMGTVGQQTADQQIQRMMQEFGRTQNAMLPAFMSLISGSPMQQANYGPSTISQLGSLLGGGLSLAGQLGWRPFGNNNNGGWF